jgi:hypothetical protein
VVVQVDPRYQGFFDGVIEALELRGLQVDSSLPALGIVAGHVAAWKATDFCSKADDIPGVLSASRL